MPVPHTSENFGDLLDPRFQRIFSEERDQLPDMLPGLFSFTPSNGRNNMTWSDIGTLPDFTEFTGTVNFESQNQGFDVTATYVQWTSGIQVERQLFDDDQFNVMDQRPRALAASQVRTRQKHGARVFNNAFSVDPLFYVNSEGVALCSNAHLTNSSASTAAGFDNVVTTGLSAAAVAAARIQMVDFRGDQAERISVVPDELWIPNNLFEEAFEITASRGKLDVANNNANVHEGQYRVMEWNYMNVDANNWFLVDSTTRRTMLTWVDRISTEFAMVEDFDTLLAKWRAYSRYAWAWTDWRWILGASVS